MKVLFLCSGNTCRSPMAEGIFRNMVRKAGLENKILCQSAGFSAAEGMPAAGNAIAACREIGIDLRDHRARKFTGEELPMWDVFFVMNDTHAYILERAGVPAENIYVPSQIDDPYGQSLEVYRRCRDKLASEVERFYNSLTAGLTEGNGDA